MANFVNVEALRGWMNGELDWDSNTWRVLLFDSTSTILTEKIKNTLSGYTTLGELSGSGYSRKTLASLTITEDNTTDFLVTGDAADVTWTAINAGTAAGCLIFKFVTNDADSVPFLTETVGFPVVTNGSDFTLQWSASGIFRMKTG